MGLIEGTSRMAKVDMPVADVVAAVEDYSSDLERMDCILEPPPLLPVQDWHNYSAFADCYRDRRYTRTRPGGEL